MTALNIALLSRAHGVHRFCRLLCPGFAPEESMEPLLGFGKLNIR